MSAASTTTPDRDGGGGLGRADVDALVSGPAPGGRARSIPLLGLPEFRPTFLLAVPRVFELARPGRRAGTFRPTGAPVWDAEDLVPAGHLRPEPLALVEVSERDLVAHVTRLSHRQYSVDLGAYPLGSCTMKYNPKLCDDAAALAGLTGAHPAAPASVNQGWLELLADLAAALCEITGMHAASLQPPAGAAGELLGLLLMRAWHAGRGETRSKVVIPDSAHGTNPASVTLGGFEVVTVPSDERGLVDLDALRAVLDHDVAGIMLTNPNTASSRRTSPRWPPRSTRSEACSTTTGPTSTPSSGSPAPGTWASTSST